MHDARRHLLRTSSFSNLEVQRGAIGAGVIPVARSADGVLHLLLAREQHIVNWRGSCKWSGFEGGRKPGEAIRETAIREWREESLNSIPGVVSTIRSGDYVCRYTLNIVHPIAARRAETVADRYHVTFVVFIPFDETVISTFSNRRTALIHVQRCASALTRASYDLTGASNVVDVHTDAEGRVCSVTGPDSTEYTEGEQFGAWCNAHRALTASVTCVDATEGITSHLGASGNLTHVTVHSDYLEKERIAWWSLGTLRQAIFNGGHLHDEHFRTYFLPVLYGVVEFLEAYDGARHAGTETTLTV